MIISLFILLKKSMIMDDMCYQIVVPRTMKIKCENESYTDFALVNYGDVLSNCFCTHPMVLLIQKQTEKELNVDLHTNLIIPRNAFKMYSVVVRIFLQPDEIATLSFQEHWFNNPCREYISHNCVEPLLFYSK
jgi:hypothetical protein